MENGNARDHKSCTSFRMPDIIRKKRDGHELTTDEIHWFIDGVVNKHGACEDAQLGALLMAIYQNGMTPHETEILTSAMTKSGDILDWPDSWRGKLVDKHSTGGVGDKISLVLAPALAACGMKVPMISGRGLGHTGGTLDKLESILGYNVLFKHQEIIQILEKVGCCIVGQSSNLVPADKKLYATRDVTSTVESLPLIAASIISKKAAESVDALVLDVKFGKAAFMKTECEGRKLAKALVNASEGQGVKTIALLTDMESPVGNTIGNALEVAEALQCLQGSGPDDLMELVCQLGGHLLTLTHNALSEDDGVNDIHNSLCDGTALKCFEKMLVTQGVAADLAEKLCAKEMQDIDDVWKQLKRAKHSTDIKIPRDGFIESIDAYELAVVSQKLGAGRAKATDNIDHAVGIRLFVGQGSKVKEGETWIRVYHNEAALPIETVETIQKAVTVVDTEVLKSSRIIDVIKPDHAD
ncbi:thymidine phosphorylase-like [Amphiura filiformis]|uniref:thymidine phosphorylase-like n=1 Tax=Amphiura filiformis TaxID=82378 RepID=UPI003B223B3C